MDLIPGNIYVRKEVHDEYGGSRYSGITPTKEQRKYSFGPMSQARITVIKMAGAKIKIFTTTQVLAYAGTKS